MSPKLLLDGYVLYVTLAIGTMVLYCWHRLSVKVGPQEPPLLKPAVPYIGHIIGLIRYQSGYFDQLHTKHPVPICTLPFINSKIYIVTSPLLVQSAFRSKHLSFVPFIVEFAQRSLGLSDETMLPVKAPPTAEKPGLMNDFIKGVHESMLGEHLSKINSYALKSVVASIDEMGDTFEAKSLYFWLRTMMTMVTSDSLFGSYNPLKLNPSLVDSAWDYEGGMISIMMGIPPYFAPKAYAARTALQAAFMKYYGEKHDLEPDVAQMTKARAGVLRDYGIKDADVGLFEIALLHVATSNAIPTLFWTFVFIVSSSTLTASIRDELMSAATITTMSESTKRKISFDISKFSTNCPLLVSAYREATRLASSQTVTRRVMADTTITDGQTTYLLKEGVDLQMPSGVNHMSPSNWGPNAAEFDARRFIQSEDGPKTEKEKADEKTQRRAYYPFGGGKHLCPGRNFAFAEILGTVAALVLGFDVLGTDGKVLMVPKIGRANMAEAVVKPTGEGAEMGAVFTKRKGWEDVTWDFKSGQE
ncbi:25-hydroxycholesterol 7-alpha-hydroxylase [Lachnellula suecica]|uniref:25-hydroxycholesterol 7-alpha-hydroxylase n=1 Tax=Lachnellula suecica TaxID=602035 RepID=A0A8T9C8X0_9HELO|nr:25-hydroxycholesterol 7-alpha-hydroxylase [Lachnellula suecica]